jgi:hypothetical protein
VTTAGAPIKVPESLIDQLRDRVAVNADVVASSLPKVGEEMEIIEGPFSWAQCSIFSTGWQQPCPSAGNHVESTGQSINSLFKLNLS